MLVFSPAPARIRADIRINAPRPRRAEWKRSTEFLELGDQVLTALYGTPEAPGPAEQYAAEDGGCRGAPVGLTGLDRDFVRVSTIFCASRLFFMVALPAAFPFILTGVRLALARALVGAIVNALAGRCFDDGWGNPHRSRRLGCRDPGLFSETILISGQVSGEAGQGHFGGLTTMVVSTGAIGYGESVRIVIAPL
ncbi:MAG TPA: hypothetical protein VGJ07_06720 [Rugosimonospora sp.]